ncbi:MAG TPA: phytanoyl-CoA dioxygenase family protein [Chloroflexia bacterium]|nr:phytanoyl-CoA dioxygenase family protein [Chloroflexia bacterium]
MEKTLLPDISGQIDIDSPYPLTPEQTESYRTQGFIRLKEVFTPETLAYFHPEFTGKVFELNTLHLPMEERTTYQQAFLQVTNLWEESELIKQFVLGRRLARIATELMGVSGVRLYHDQALYKESSGGITPWHADQYYWPVSNSNTITAWIPLQPTPLEMGPLAFSAGSHHLELGRDLEISDESEAFMREKLSDAQLTEVEEPFELGEVSFHSGWTFHHAGPNKTGHHREVMTIIFMDKDMRLAQPKNKYQQADWERWCPGAVLGEIIASPLNPILYERD